MSPGVSQYVATITTSRIAPTAARTAVASSTGLGTTALGKADDITALGPGGVDRSDRELQDALRATHHRHQPNPRPQSACTASTGRPSAPGLPRKTASIGKRMNIMWMPFPPSHSP